MTRYFSSVEVGLLWTIVGAPWACLYLANPPHFWGWGEVRSALLLDDGHHLFWSKAALSGPSKPDKIGLVD